MQLNDHYEHLGSNCFQEFATLYERPEWFVSSGWFGMTVIAAFVVDTLGSKVQWGVMRGMPMTQYLLFSSKEHI